MLPETDIQYRYRDIHSWTSGQYEQNSWRMLDNASFAGQQFVCLAVIHSRTAICFVRKQLIVCSTSFCLLAGQHFVFVGQQFVCETTILCRT